MALEEAYTRIINKGKKKSGPKKPRKRKPITLKPSVAAKLNQMDAAAKAFFLDALKGN